MAIESTRRGGTGIFADDPAGAVSCGGCGCGHGDGHGHEHGHEHEHEHEHEHQHEHGHRHAHHADLAAASPDRARLRPTRLADGRIRTPIRIRQMDCPTEEALIRGKLAGMTGVAALEFNLMQRVLTVTHRDDVRDAIVGAVRSLGFTPELADDPPARDEGAARPAAASWWPLGIAAVLAVVAEIAHAFEWPIGWSAGFAVAAIATCGLSTYRKGWIAIRHLRLNINALMSIAVTGAALLGDWPEAAMVMVLFTLAERIEARSLDRARHAVQGLLALAPPRATVRHDDGEWHDVDANTVAPGATVRVKPGERIALDGRIVAGRSSVNQAPITGESLPVDKAVGDPVFAGTINEAGSFEFTVTAAAEDSTLSRIIAAVEQAQATRAPTQRFVDRFASVYTPVVFALALGVAIVPPWWNGGGWWEWAYRALVMLVIACPCALVIATPVTIVSGLTTAARQGILVKGGVYLETGRRLRWLALDKTGTITKGRPALTDVSWVDTDGRPQAAADARGSGPVREAASVAAGLARRSDHPAARAIAAALIAPAAPDPGADAVQAADVDEFEAVGGRGVRGVVDGRQWQLGSPAWMRESGLAMATLAAPIEAFERQGRTVVCLADARRVHALFAVADTVRETSREAIDALHALGVRTAMLSGDNAGAAERIAASVGIDEVRAGLLPDDKRVAIVERQRGGDAVGMVGDGINDAPALAQADIGFAMGAAGSGTAIETADVALMDDDLRKLPAFIALSRRTYRVLWQNIVIALGIKAVFFALTLTGAGTMWMAVFADMGASLIVVANGLRLLRAPARSQADGSRIGHT